MDMESVKKANALALVIMVATPYTVTFAGEWKFTPSVGLDEVVSDNVTLSSIDSDKESGLVSQAYFQLNNSFESKRAELNFNFRSIYADYSHDDTLNDDFLELNAEGKFRLWDQGPELIANASIENQNRNLLQNAFSNFISADTTEVRTVGYGFEYDRTTTLFQLETRALKTSTTSEDNIGEREGEQFQFAFQNGVNPTKVVWNVAAAYAKFQRNSLQAEQYSASLTLGYRTPWKVYPIIQLSKEDNKGRLGQQNSLNSNFAGVGINLEPSSQFNISVLMNESLDGQDESETFISTILKWTPSRRTAVLFSNSRRFFGNSYNLSVKHLTKRFENTIAYREQVQAFTRNNYDVVFSGNFICPITQGPQIDATDNTQCFLPAGDTPIDFDNYIVKPIFRIDLLDDDQYVLDKSFQWNSSLKLKRGQISINVANNDITFLDSNRENNRRSASATISHNLSRKTTLNINYTVQRNEFDREGSELSQTDHYKLGSIGLSYELGKTIKSTLTLRNTDRNSSRQQFNYQENQLSLTLTKDF